MEKCPVCKGKLRHNTTSEGLACQQCGRLRVKGDVGWETKPQQVSVDPSKIKEGESYSEAVKVVFKKRTHIYYNYNGVNMTFAFEEGFHGQIPSREHGLMCTILNDEKDSTVIYITDSFGGAELLRVVIGK